jgi:hypothetical protein
MPRTPSQTLISTVHNITYENIVGIGQNANFLSGRSPGNAPTMVTLRNVSLNIDRWPSWNYSHPDHDYRPTTCVPMDLEPAPTDGIFVERVEGLTLINVTVTFNAANRQPYWTNVCFNLTNAAFPVYSKNLVCNIS